MELLKGPTLREYLAARGPLEESEALDIALQLCGGLQAAHDQGVVHRDLKSANVILAAESEGFRAVITDFGLARPLATGTESHTTTQAGMLVGTLDYMAPELLRGQPATVQSDLYALGVLLFEMVAGALPHQGAASIDQLLNRFLEPAASPRNLVSSVSRKWDAVTRKCLDRDPSLRGRSAGQIAEALRRGGPSFAARLNRRRLLLGSAGTAAAAIGGAIWWSVRPVRVIVFAIENQSGDPGLNYLCQGATTELIRQLALSPGVRIIPYYGPKPKTPRSLPAAYTLAGTMQKGSGLRVELADAGDGAIVWSQQFDSGRYQNPLQVQIELARAVVRAFQQVHPAVAAFSRFLA